MDIIYVINENVIKVVNKVLNKVILFMIDNLKFKVLILIV